MDRATKRTGQSPDARKRPKTESADHQADKEVCGGYEGYRVQKGDAVEEIGEQGIAQARFFSRYVRLRRPAKFMTMSGLQDVFGGRFSPSELEQTLAYEGTLTVERKHKGGFGSGQRRERMLLAELMAKFRAGDDSYYLTTQYEEEESGSGSDSEGDGEQEDVLEVALDARSSADGGEPAWPALESDDESLNIGNAHDDFDDVVSLDEEIDLESARRVRELFQPPLCAIRDQIPLVPPFLAGLVPQQINLWAGFSKENPVPSDILDPDSRYVPGGANSSGLHHDHADNLYLLFNGRKRFTLYSPADAHKLYTVGTIRKIYNSGVIDYEADDNAPSWCHVRDDGALVREVARWRLAQGDLDPATRADLEAVLEREEGGEGHRDATRSSNRDSTDLARSPPSFSRIPPALLHLDELTPELRKELEEFSNTHFPGFLQLNKLTVWLSPGEMLYLPTGWFHEVSSFANETVRSNEDRIHIAVNYWFVPPNGSSPEQPYADSYWLEDFELTKRAIAAQHAQGALPDAHHDPLA